MKQNKLDRKISFVGNRLYTGGTSNSYTKQCECCSKSNAWKVVEFTNGDVEYVCDDCIAKIQGASM